MLEEEVKSKLQPTMLDPSVICAVDFWRTTRNLKRIFPVIYVPESIKEMENLEFRKFYGGRLRTERILSVEEVVKRSHEAFRFFSWKEYSEEVPEQFRVGFDNLRRGLGQSYISKSIQNALLDEFVFLTTQSSILSRLKKIFRVFEKFDAIPLLNLEKKATEEWKKSVRGAKKACGVINWIGSMVVFSLLFGPVVGLFAGSGVTGVRLLIVDP